MLFVFSDREIVKEKIQQARGLMAEHGVDAWFLVDTEGRDPALSLLVGGATSGRSLYVFDRRGPVRAVTGFPDKGHLEALGVFDEVICTEKATMEELMVFLHDDISPGRFMLNYSEGDSLCDGLSHGTFLWISRVLGPERMKGAISSEPVLQQLRAVKSAEELDRVQRSIDFNLEIYEEVSSQLAGGLTEKEIQALFRRAIDRRVPQGVMPQDGPLVLLPKAGMAHREPTDARLEPGDMLVIDFGLGFRGYHSDIARTFYHLRPGEERAPDAILDAFRAVRGAIHASFSAMRPGVAGFEVDRIAREHLVERGYPPIKHSLGHQIGQQVHDGGTSLRPLRPGQDPNEAGRLQEGELYTLEPTILEGELSIISEENVRVTDHGAENLHPWQTELWYIP